MNLIHFMLNLSVAEHPNQRAIVKHSLLVHAVLGTNIWRFYLELHKFSYIL